MSSSTKTLSDRQISDEQLARDADEKQMKRMSHASMARRAVCPRCGKKESYTFRRNGEPLFGCYGCHCAFDEAGVQR